MTDIELEAHIAALRNTLQEIRASYVRVAGGEEKCPLNVDGLHYDLSEIVFGTGWSWTCDICGTNHNS